MTTSSQPPDPGQLGLPDDPGDVAAERPVSLDRLEILTGRWEMEATFDAGYFAPGSR